MLGLKCEVVESREETGDWWMKVAERKRGSGEYFSVNHSLSSTTSSVVQVFCMTADRRF